MAEFETSGVLICGCGPTGAMLSGVLERMDVPNIVLEKESGITTNPRDSVLDDDRIRFRQPFANTSSQRLGYVGDIPWLAHFRRFSIDLSGIPRVRFVAGVHHNPNKKPSMCFDTRSVGQVFG
ncbi:hypothetical protein DL98DRAFT_164143 [Cadophora sp. DSE1049]|nr:hypothetical protein DL98DRAFT_164143 [Cadophora sp. DSE1049]